MWKYIVKNWIYGLITIILVAALFWLGHSKLWASGESYIVTDEGLKTHCEYVKVKGADYIRCYTAYGYYIIYPDRGEKK